MPLGRDRPHPEPETLLLADEDLLGPAQRTALDAHLTSCAECRARQESLRRAQIAATADLGSLRAIDQVPAAQARVRLEAALAAARRRSPITRPPTPFAAQWWLRLAATIAVVGLVFASTDRSGDERAANDDPPLILPISALTPGLARSVSMQEICSDDPPQDGRVPGSMRGVVLASYGMTHLASDEYELDYLITPELGGARDPRNLWPERYASGPWNARVKDELEALLPDLVCRGQLDLATAQRDIAANWVDAYRKYFGTDRPLRSYAGAPDLSFPPRQPDR